MSFDAKPVMFDGLDAIFDEKGSMFLSMRKVQWVKDGAEPDASKAKLELRKWIVGPDGVEKAHKGVTFLTDDGPHELAKTLVHHGYGKTKEILLELKGREDFKESVDTLFDEDTTDNGTGEYFDMRSALLASNDEEEEEDE